MDILKHIQTYIYFDGTQVEKRFKINFVTIIHIHYNIMYNDYCPYIQSQRLLFNNKNNENTLLEKKFTKIL